MENVFDSISTKEALIEQSKNILNYLCSKCEEGVRLEDFAPKVRELDECAYDCCFMHRFNPYTISPFIKRKEGEKFAGIKGPILSTNDAYQLETLLLAAVGAANHIPVMIQKGFKDNILTRFCKFIGEIEDTVDVHGNIWQALTSPKNGMEIICIMGRSGSGKSTLGSTLESLGYKRIISCTTRPPRGMERDGVEYHFVSRDKFAKLIEEGSLLEYAEYNGNLYGSPKPAASENVVVLEPKGYANLKRKYPETFGVYIDVLKDTIIQRFSIWKDTSPEVIAERMAEDEKVFADIQKKVDFVLDGRMPIEKAAEEVIRRAEKKRGEGV